MKRLIIICEGETERNFCQHLLYQHFATRQIHIAYPLIKRSAGGIGSWESLKKQIITHLNESGAYVTTFIDMYGIKDSYNFPDWMPSKEIPNVKDRVRHIESAMNLDINHRNFIGNIIVHEFETLLFSDITIIQQLIDNSELNYPNLQTIINQHPDIELINNGTTTAPSKRLENNITGYIKSIHGHYLAESIGLPVIRQKCLKFNEWISKLEQI